MPNNNQNQIAELQKQIDALRAEVYSNNFKTSQDFNKASRFNTVLKVPRYGSDPATCEVGEIIEVGGKLKICSAANTWTIVGTQT
jgi:hypothetical protein